MKILFKAIRLTAIFAVVLAGIIFTEYYNSRDYSGRAKVIDGDSLRISGHEIRLFGIDAPEYDQTCRNFEGDKVFECGKDARRQLMRFVNSIEIVCRSSQTDKYQRHLAICISGEIELNKEMVRTGWALAFGAYFAEEQEARRNRLGLWQGQFETPSKWRQDKREQHQSTWLVKILNWLTN